MSYTSLDSPKTQQPHLKSDSSFINLARNTPQTQTYFKGQGYQIDESQDKQKTEGIENRSCLELIDIFHVIVEINESESSLREFDELQFENTNTVYKADLVSLVHKFQSNNQIMTIKMKDFRQKKKNYDNKIRDLKDILELSSTRLFSLKNIKKMLEQQKTYQIKQKNHSKQKKIEEDLQKISCLIENMEKQYKITAKVLEALSILVQLQQTMWQDLEKINKQSHVPDFFINQQNKKQNFSYLNQKCLELKNSIEKFGSNFSSFQEIKISQYQNDINQQQKIVKDLINQVNQLNCQQFTPLPAEASQILFINTLHTQEKTLEILQQAIQWIEEVKNQLKSFQAPQKVLQQQTQKIIQQQQTSRLGNRKESQQNLSREHLGDKQKNVFQIQEVKFPQLQQTIFQIKNSNSQQIQKKKPLGATSQILNELAKNFFDETLDFVIKNKFEVEQFFPHQGELFQKEVRSLTSQNFSKYSLHGLAALIKKHFNQNDIKNIFKDKLEQLRKFYQVIN